MNEQIILEGIAASPGRVTGKVKVLTGPDDGEKVEAGDILVSQETTPEYMPAILRAAAIVTDRGGLLSHSAVVAREWGIPGVVGTEMATQILKDNMEVTVDGDNGYVLNSD